MDTLCLDLRHQIGFDANGGYAERVVVPARNLVQVPSALTDAEAAILPDAVATAVHAVVDRAQIKVGDRVLVIGAGGVGIHVAQLSLLSGGYTVVADVDESKVALAKAMGADETLLISGLDNLPSSLKVNKVIEAAGALREFRWVGRVLQPGGTLVTVGYTMGESIALESVELIASEFEIRGCKASTLGNLVTAVELVANGKLRAVVDKQFSLAEANEALAKLASGQLSGRAVLVPE
jgi:D-arabinose 1-dehydrogenase-like Zn-dependent alcohol dehydrogenase